MPPGRDHPPLSRSTIIAAGLGLSLVALAATSAFVAYEPQIAGIAPADPGSFNANLVKQGQILAGIGNCAACHTLPDGEPYAGGRALPTPFGVIHSTNLTPDPETGIGTWSEAAFARAMRHGVDREGRHLYPVFPYDYFTRASDADLGALYAYLMSLDPIVAEAAQNDLVFPFSVRPLLAGWKVLYLDEGALQPDPAQDEEWNRGRYLVESLGHCGACHSPRNALGAAAKTGPKAYAGGEAEGWSVPPLNGASSAPLEWNVDSIANYLIEGWDSDHGVAAGPMRPVVDDLHEQSEDDVVAMAVYVDWLMGNDRPENASLAATRANAKALDWGHPDAPILPEESALLAGARVFEANCANCHKAGAKSVPLALTTVLHAPDAANLINIVLHGIQPPPVGSPDRSMPGRAVQVSDDDLVALAAFVRDRFTDATSWTGVRELVQELRGHN